MDTCFLVPPLDVAYAWLVHRLNPTAYAADCNRISKARRIFDSTPVPSASPSDVHRCIMIADVYNPGYKPGPFAFTGSETRRLYYYQTDLDIEPPCPKMATFKLWSSVVKRTRPKAWKGHPEPFFPPIL
ncbi:hypothetical protein CEUSTIGMA_g12641.t1 [Chlamydomonas eustigma]|uniref:Uncharacterized protein n=1 Tax=Chlamydomonas eustigma TaxID=1157962 RepID=A0A250XQ65_9CHLO|nr:hypothetical protein CEUSTIGMA_g12641.t1 [Chlamydomonas eustigma]|eukprot:GAX85221.1 hypothetical protein CEUSTIGMA_g12641.t1 [Chlamydomonas eustigma]